MREIVVATKNAGKVNEIISLLAELPVKILSLADCGDIPAAVEDGDSFAANAVIKARHYARLTGRACLADDSGLEVDALNGGPGIYSARYAGENSDAQANNRKLLTALTGLPAERRRARFRCVAAFIDGEGVMATTEGVCEGIILTAPRGSGGFGYDPLFYVPAVGKTMAELSPPEKNSLSHRGQALRKMVGKLRERLACE